MKIYHTNERNNLPTGSTDTNCQIYVTPAMSLTHFQPSDISVPIINLHFTFIISYSNRNMLAMLQPHTHALSHIYIQKQGLEGFHNCNCFLINYSHFHLDVIVPLNRVKVVWQWVQVVTTPTIQSFHNNFRNELQTYS